MAYQFEFCSIIYRTSLNAENEKPFKFTEKLMPREFYNIKTLIMAVSPNFDVKAMPVKLSLLEF